MLTPITELYLGPARGWVDISDDVRVQTATSGGGISITRGRAREGAQTDPGSCSLTLNNRTGRYSPRNPTSDLYGVIGRNTPLRVRLPGPAGGDRRLEWHQATGAAATTPYTPDLHLNAIDARVDFELLPQHRGPGARVSLLGRWPGLGADPSWLLTLSASRTVVGWVYTGAERTVRVVESAPLTITGRMALRMVYIGDDAGARRWRLYQAPTIDGPWTQIWQAGVTGGAALPSASTAPLELGTSTIFTDAADPVGRIYAAELRASVDGPVLAGIDFRTADAAMPGSVLPGTGGRQWTLGQAAAVRDPSARISAEVSEWPARWDLSGADRWTPVTAAGILRRLGQGARPLHSPLRRHLDQYGPIAYLPLEDGSDAERPSSAIAGAPPATWAEVTSGSDNAPAGAASAVDLAGAASKVTMPVPAISSNAWGSIFFFRLSAVPTSEVEVARIDVVGGTAITWRFLVGPGTVRWLGHTAAGVQVGDVYASAQVDMTRWTAMHLGLEQQGGTVQAMAIWHQVGAASMWTFTRTHVGAIGAPRQVTVTGSASLAVQMSHLAVVDRHLPIVSERFRMVASGYRGERAGDRMVRLSAEQGVPLIVASPTGDTEPMGPQQPATYLDLMQECADADGGVLGEARDVLALEYRPRVSLYNQTPVSLSYAAGQIGDGIEPVDDDDGVTNSVEVTRTGGGSARAELTSGRMSTRPPPAGVGVYDSSATLSLATDARLPDHAGWRLHLGTVDEVRYPRVPLRLYSPRWDALPQLRQDVAALDAGDVAEVAGLPGWATGDGQALVMVQGYTEVIESHRWDITWTTSPGSPWRVASVGGGQRIAAVGTRLEEPLSASGMSVWMVSLPANGAWTTDAGNFPLDIRLDNGAGLVEHIRVSAITGTSYSQQLVISHRGLGGVQRAWPVGTRVDVWDPAIPAL